MSVSRLYVGLFTALALCKYSLANWNVTEESFSPTVAPCRRHSNGHNCTGESRFANTTVTTETTWGGHFSKCPEELRYYCIQGDCRYVKEQRTVSCRCHDGYYGERCAYLMLGWRIGRNEQIAIYCSVAGLVVLIIVIISICVNSHRRSRRLRMRRQREEERNGSEKLHMMDTDLAHSGSAAPTRIHSV